MKMQYRLIHTYSNCLLLRYVNDRLTSVNLVYIKLARPDLREEAPDSTPECALAKIKSMYETQVIQLEPLELDAVHPRS